MKIAMVVVVLCLAVLPAAAQVTPDVLGLKGAGPVVLFPFVEDEPVRAGIGVTLQLLPIAAPEELTLATSLQYVGNALGLDLIWPTTDYTGVVAGVSLQLYQAGSQTPVRAGLTYLNDAGVTGYLKFDIPIL